MLRKCSAVLFSLSSHSCFYSACWSEEKEQVVHLLTLSCWQVYYGGVNKTKNTLFYIHNALYDCESIIPEIQGGKHTGSYVTCPCDIQSTDISNIYSAANPNPNPQTNTQVSQYSQCFHHSVPTCQLVALHQRSITSSWFSKVGWRHTHTQTIYQCCVSSALCCIAGCLAVNSEITAHSLCL